MRQLTRFGTAGQVYRAGELIFPRRPGGLPRIPAGWGFGMRVGVPASGSVGFQVAARGEAFGALNPPTFSGQIVGVLLCSGANTLMLYLGATGGVQLPGMNAVTLTSEGGFSSKMVWSGANLRYAKGPEAALAAFWRSKAGQVIGVTLVASPTAFEAPYPWEGLSTHAAINDWVEEMDLEVPTTWFALTLPLKKEALKEAFG